MKIYVEDKNNEILKKIDLNTKVLQKFEKYLEHCQIINKIYSKQGFYEISNNKLYNLKLVSDKVAKQKINFDKYEYTLFIDNSKIEKHIVFQIPYEHVCVSLKVTSYVNSCNKNLKLVVETLYDINKNIEIRPINYYFEYNIENNVIPIDDINVFLSLLN
jgi:hypothetical protein